MENELVGAFRTPHDGPTKWLMTFTAYLDESGHETKDRVFIAGFLGNEAQWKQLIPLWRTALGKRRALHMNELRWGHPRTKKLLERLGPIPDECKLTPILGGVRVSDYEDLVAGTIDEKLLKGYIACLFPLVLQLLRVIPDDDRVELIFEKQKEYEPNADLVLSALVNLMDERIPGGRGTDGRPKLAKWSFVPKDSTILTQPADYFAYALQQVWRDKKSQKTEWCKPILNSGGGEGVGGIMNRAEIRKTIKRAQIMTIYQAIQQRLRGLPR